MSHAAAPVPPADLVPAGVEPRFLAYLLDRAAAWLLAAGIACAVWLAVAPDHVWVGLATFGGLVVLFGAVAAFLTGATGATPGKLVLGLRVVRCSDGRPIGVGPSLMRTIVLGIGGLPTLGLGDAMLAWTALSDPRGDRRAAHDRYGDAMVVDVRPRPPAEATDATAQPKAIVNLTALRLLPDPEPAPVRVEPPASTPAASSPVPAPAAGLASTPATASPAPAPAGARPALPPPPAAVPPAPAASRHAGPPPTAPPTAPPTTPTAPGALPPRPMVRWRVSFDTGEAFAVEGLAIVGRRPEARPDEPVRHVVALRSSDMSLSKTHAQFQVAPDGALVVMDRGSTNGSFVVRRGHSRPLNPGRPSTLLDGDLVRFGDRTMSVVRES